MIDGAKVYTFEFTCSDGTTRQESFPSASKQLAWITAAGFVACHTMNPSVTGMRLVKEAKIKNIALNDDEFSEHEAIKMLHNL